ncbi:MAG: hypothetical protein CMJ98_05240 [Planctomycetes bacterium]|nr:hypothetical protein [Planctomycetota bacterium]
MPSGRGPRILSPMATSPPLDLSESPGACPTAADWEELLIESLRRPVQVSFGTSRTVPVRAEERGQPPVFCVRLHKAFSEAPLEVCDSLARWLLVGRRARRACTLLDNWIDQRMKREPTPSRSAPTLHPNGSTYDLGTLSQDVLNQYFKGHFGQERPLPGLTWGRRARSRSRHSLRLGSYDPVTHVIRIHPVLDQPEVPRWFVCFVLAHELLHAKWPPMRGSGQRWIHHGAQFRAEEAAHPDFKRAQDWETLQLPGLIRSARRGTKFRAKRSRGLRNLLGRQGSR